MHFSFCTCGTLNSVGRYYKLTVVVCNNHNFILVFVFDSFTQMFTKISAVSFLLSVVDRSY